MRYLVYKTSRPLVAFVLFCLANTSFAFNFFGPKNFEDCLLKGMKGVSSDSAAQAVIFACKKKFPNHHSSSDRFKPSENIEFNEYGQRVCRIFWDGSRFERDRKNIRNGFKIVEAVYDPTQVLYIVSIPNAMYTFWKSDNEGLDINFKRFLASRKSSIDRVCNL